MPILKNAKHEIFAQEVAKGSHIDAAYVAAGYQEHAPNAIRLRRNDKVAARIAEIQERAFRRTNITVERIAEELARIGFSNVTDAVTVKRGRVRIADTNELDDDVTAAISEIRQTKDGVSVKFHDKQAALLALAKHAGMFKENINLNVTVSLADLVNASYQPEQLPTPEMKTVEGKET